MRSLQRNRKTLWYRLYSDQTTPTYDEWGNETGESTPSYGSPVEMKANISPATGASITEQFGNLDDYDKVIVTSDLTCPINEQTILYIDTAPTRDATTGSWSPHDYVVRRVAKSLNGISIAVRKVSVSGNV